MSEDIKSTAIPASGYIYQTRQGLSVLCDWLDSPSRYQRVMFECDDDAVAPTGLDDIVAERADGLVDLRQVKYTPSPELHPLSWDWMLEKSGTTERSRSMLRKWFDAYAKLDPSRMGEISLRTNRRPDACIEACMEDGRISFAKVPESMRVKVIEAIGSEQKCEAFFKQLLVLHSDKGFETLEFDVDARLRRHGKPEGVATLKNVALNWATRKNCPPPDGWISLDQVRTILRAQPPAPLPEDFLVPPGYEVPDETFHRDFVRSVLAAAGQVIVLTGPPGRGKSTYLSVLFEELGESGIPAVRHHYFLSTTERGRDRVNSYAVEQAIEAQLKRVHPDAAGSGGSLRSLLEATSSHYKSLGKPFVLVMDGLDHVWRINSHDKRPLTDLFAQLIPPPDNMVLLVGTQPVDDAQLPTDLLASAPKDEWKTLPAMSENAVLSHLRKALEEGRLSTGFEGTGESERQLQETAEALRRATNGHPLHVIYATAELMLSGRKLSRWDVEQLTGDLSKDAKFYYASLWEVLPESLKDTLRLVCAFPFFWPKAAFSEIAAEMKSAVPDVEKVQHLFHSSAAGLKVFHESLAVFVRATPGYTQRIDQLTPAVASWLENKAPDALRVNWLWTVQARQGDATNLITGLTRDWVMLRLEEGYPEALFDVLLSDALVAALDSHKFAHAWRLAHLKGRMVGGSEFQMQSDDMARLVSYTLALTTEEGVLREAVASRHDTDLLLVAALGLALQARGDLALADKCGEEALHRFRGQNRFSNRYSSNSGSDEFSFLVDAFARLGVIGTDQEALIKLVSGNGSVVWIPLVNMLVEDGSLDDLMAAASSLKHRTKKCLLSDASVRAAPVAGVRIVDRPDFSELARTPLLAAIDVACTRVSKPLNEEIPIDWLKGDYYGRKEDLATLVHHWFFSSVHLCLCMAAEGQSLFDMVPAPAFKDRRNVTVFLDNLTGAAVQVAQRWWDGEFVDFHVLYELLDSLDFKRFRSSHNEYSSTEDFLSALHRVACDIRLGSLLLKPSDEDLLTLDTVVSAEQAAWFDSVSFRTQYAARLLTRMTDEAAAAFVHSQRTLLDAEVRQETSVHLQAPLQLCAIALAHGLSGSARELCKQTWELTTGYSHRKDPTLNNTLEAIDYLVEVAPDEAKRLLARVAPQVHQVLDYTDGKGTRHVLAAADRLLAKLQPTALVVKYEEHVDAGDWSLAEESMRAYVEQGVQDGWPLDELMRTGLHPEVHDELKRISQDGSAGATERLRVLQEHTGWDIGVLQLPERAGSSSSSKPYSGDVTSFSPEQIDALLQSLSSSYDDQEMLLRTWYQHWEAAGQGPQLLVALDPLLLTEKGRVRGILVLSDLAFETRRKLGGAKAAWDYLVQAQILKGAWIGFGEKTESTLQRLDLVVKRYPRRCDEFVAATTYSMFGDPVPPRIAPSELMVYFYSRQKRVAEAVEFAETMVNCIIEDTRTLPLKPPRWASSLVSHSGALS